MFGGRKVPRTGGILISQHKVKRNSSVMVLLIPSFKAVVSYTITEFVPVMAAPAYSHLLDQ